MNKIQVLLSNKHTSGAAILVMTASAVQYLGPLWFPSYAHQCEETGKWLARTAMTYGLLLAGDAKPTLTNTEPTAKVTT